MMQVKVKIAPENLLTLEEVKEYLNVDFNDYDNLLIDLIKGVVDFAERFTQSSFATRTLIAYSECWDSEEYLPYGPHQSVESVIRIDSNNIESILTPSEYVVYGLNQFRVSPNRYWSTEGNSFNRIKVEYIAGYGEPSQVPALIKLAIKKEIAELFENRENSANGISVASLSSTTKKLLEPYKNNVLI